MLLPCMIRLKKLDVLYFTVYNILESEKFSTLRRPDAVQKSQIY